MDATALAQRLIRNIVSADLQRQERAPLYDTLCASLAAGSAAVKLGASIDIVAPGKRGCPYHFHLAQEEMFVIIEGNGSLRVAGEMLPVPAGDVIFIPPGPDYPHQLINTSHAPLKLLSISTQESPELCVYPDSGKYGGFRPGPRAGAARGRQPGLLGRRAVATGPAHSLIIFHRILKGACAMASVNKVIVIGNLGRDPEVRYMPSGSAICNITVATSRQWKDKTSGDKQEETEWHRIVFFDRMAEIAGEYLKKGRPVYVEGRLKTRKWTDKDGVEKYTTEIVATEMQLLGSREGMGGGDDGGGGGGGGYRAGSRERPAARPSAAAVRPRPSRPRSRAPASTTWTTTFRSRPGPQGRTLPRQRFTSCGRTAGAWLPQALRM